MSLLNANTVDHHQNGRNPLSRRRIMFPPASDAEQLVLLLRTEAGAHKHLKMGLHCSKTTGLFVFPPETKSRLYEGCKQLMKM